MTRYPRIDNPVARAVVLVGSQTALAHLLGVTPQAVSRWVQCGCAPAKRLVQIERATAGRVTRQELNPALFADMAPAAFIERQDLPV